MERALYDEGEPNSLPTKRSLQPRLLSVAAIPRPVTICMKQPSCWIVIVSSNSVMHYHNARPAVRPFLTNTVIPTEPLRQLKKR